MKINRENNRFEIEVDGKVVGQGQMVLSEEGEMAYLERIDIEEEHRNKGYGTEALYALLDTYGPYFLAPDNPDCKRWLDRVADEHTGEGWPVDQGYGVYELQ